jgi:site-specific DNA-adenine methylase
MFFHSLSRDMKFNAYLSDKNVELVIAFNAIRDNPKRVIELRKYDYEYKSVTQTGDTFSHQAARLPWSTLTH